MENNQLIPKCIVEAILEDVISSDFEREVAMTRLRRMASSVSNVGGVRNDL